MFPLTENIFCGTLNYFRDSSKCFLFFTHLGKHRAAPKGTIPKVNSTLSKSESIIANEIPQGSSSFVTGNGWLAVKSAMGILKDCVPGAFVPINTVNPIPTQNSQSCKQSLHFRSLSGMYLIKWNLVTINSFHLAIDVTR